MSNITPGTKSSESPKLARVLAGLHAHEGRELEGEAPPGDEAPVDGDPTEDGDPTTAGAPDEDLKPLVGIPEWFVMPEGGVQVEPGTPVRFLRVPARFTNRPGGKERHLLLTTHTMLDEKLAYQRAAASPNSKINKFTVDELAKQTIRVIDGKRADWSGRNVEASVNRTWAELGPRVQVTIRDWYLKTHTMNLEEQIGFFRDCVEDRVWGE